MNHGMDEVQESAAEMGTEPPSVLNSGAQQWALLATDSVLSFVRLLKAEASLALSALPGLVMMAVLRIPMFVVTWIGFTVLAGMVAYTITASPLAGVATFFFLQAGATLMLERRFRHTRRLCSLPESRRNAEMVAAALGGRFRQEHES